MFCSLQLCVPLGISELIVENDSLLAVKVVLEGEDSCILQSDVIQEILQMSSLFHSCSFQYISQLSSNVAHTLVRYVWQVDDLCVWWDSVPDFLHSPLWLDADPGL